MAVKKYVPHIITCCNLVSGCISLMEAMKENWTAAAICIIVSAVFDFFDGFFARLFKAKSSIGKELDSLADIVSFGLAPGMILYTWLTHCLMDIRPSAINGFTKFLPMLALLVPVLSAVRLAKFNTDSEQEVEFVGLPTPANAFFLGFLPQAAAKVALLNNFWVVLGLTVLFALLLLIPIPMFSLKFRNLKWKGNEVRYILIIIAVILIPLLRFGAFPLIILTYLFLSFLLDIIHKL